MTITSLDELDKVLKVLRENGVKHFNFGEFNLTLEYEFVGGDGEEEDDMDKKEPVSAMGFETADYSTLNVKTQFDE